MRYRKRGSDVYLGDDGEDHGHQHRQEAHQSEQTTKPFAIISYNWINSFMPSDESLIDGWLVHVGVQLAICMA